MAPRGNFFGAANRMKTSPIPVQRTTRTLPQRVLTSLNAGQVVPLLAIPLLREDSLVSASFRIGFEMEETVEVLMNGVNVRVQAHVVSNLCMERFGGSLDVLNKSYEGLPPTEGGTVIPWFETVAAPAPGTSAILTALGKHFREGTMINTAYIEAYNAIWNHRATQRSPDIPLRARLDHTLAPAFWIQQTFAHIVPDFDQAVIDGEVALNVVDTRLPVSGIGLRKDHIGASTSLIVHETAPLGEQTVTGWIDNAPGGGTGAGTASITIQQQPGTATAPMVWAEFIDNNISVSLSNIEMARKTQAFANLRRQYSGHSDEYIIDLLMDGISIPDQMWKQPILLCDETTTFGMSKRYASDGASLTESVVNGMTFLECGFSCPRVNAGGVIIITAEIAPEQLFERQKDPYLHATGLQDLPQFLPDTLDPEKVVVVKNDEIDIDHDTPDATFGYAPLNHQWLRGIPNLGGKFYRPAVDAEFDEDRQRVWAVETQNPVLSKDFYLVTTMHYKPFVVTDEAIDHFEVLLRGTYTIRGNTVFGGLLVEATNDYEKIEEEQRHDRIEKPTGTTTDKAKPTQETPAAAAARRQSEKEVKKPATPAPAKTK